MTRIDPAAILLLASRGHGSIHDVIKVQLLAKTDLLASSGLSMEKRVEVAASVLFPSTSLLNKNDSSDDSFDYLSDSDSESNSS